MFFKLLFVIFFHSVFLLATADEEALYSIPLFPGLKLNLKTGDDPCAELVQYCIELNITSTFTRLCLQKYQQKVLQEILKFPIFMSKLDIKEGLFMMCQQILPRYHQDGHHQFSPFHREMSTLVHSIYPGDFAAMKFFELRKSEQPMEVIEEIDLYGNALITHPNSSFIISQLGLSLQRSGRGDLAMSLFSNAVHRGIWNHVLHRPEWYRLPVNVSKPWHDPEDYPFIARIASNYTVIRSELIASFKRSNVTFEEVVNSIKLVLDGNMWTVLALKHADSENYTSHSTIFFPKTTQILQNCGRDVIEVKFSTILPGTRIYPHTGPSNDRLRGHLTLVHTGGAKIRAGREWRTWEEGKVLVFDSSWEHEVIHEGPDPRVVMIFDFWNKDS